VSVLDERWIRSLHVEALRHADLNAEHEPHVLFQASTIGALLEGAYDGDVTIAELAEHGDLGLGTLNGLDGEMIALDGRFYRADVEGEVTEVEASARTPFAVVAPFSPAIELDLQGPLDHEELLARLDERTPDEAASCAVRVDGRFELVRARSVPRQEPPYRPLTEVVSDQHVFELSDVEGTMLGFRFPEYAEGIEVSGYHLHFITADRSRGGHVLGSTCAGARAQLDPSSDLHVELPPGVDLRDPELAGDTHAAVDRVEHTG
jgi:acetolactate decarboxylase